MASNYGWFGLPLGLILFVSVLLHELGHALVAERHGIPIARIDLHILGGMTLMTRRAADPRQELEVAAGGPLVSLALALTAGAAAWAVDASLSFSPMTWSTLIVFAAVLNLGMALFNMVPALPTDGGRIFRALLSMRFGHRTATVVAVWVSRAFAVAFVVAGLLQGNWLLAVLGGVLFLLAGWEQLASRPSPDEQLVQTMVQQGVDRRGELGPVTREEYVDAHGRRYVVVTRLVR